MDGVDSTIPVLDLEIYHWRKLHGDIEAIGTWYGQNSRPAMVLIRKGDYGAPAVGVSPCVIPIDGCWIFDDRIGDPRRAAEVVWSFAEHLGIDGSRRAIVQLMLVINWHLGDLLTIPPKPQDKMRAVADAFVVERETGRVVHEGVISDDV